MFDFLAKTQMYFRRIDMGIAGYPLDRLIRTTSELRRFHSSLLTDIHEHLLHCGTVNCVALEDPP